MMRVGLTGGIASGKSTIAKSFSKLRIPIISCDLIVKDLLQEEAIKNKIIHHFGSGILDKHLSIDKAQLREIIFNQIEEKTWLEDFLHPLVKSNLTTKIESTKAPYVILEIPLLIETNFFGCIDRLLVVIADEAIRIQRLQQRDNMPIGLIHKILSEQATDLERLHYADDIIENQSDIADLDQQVFYLHNHYLSLSGAESYY